MERKEAIEIVRKLYNESLFMKKDKEAMVTLIPELKEIEDARIRKGIIQYLEQSQFGEEHYQIDDDIVKDYISWLEKQKEQKKVSIWKHWKNGITGNGEGKPIYLIKHGDTYYLSSCLSFECDYIELSELDNLMLEKQDEPIDKGEIFDGYHTFNELYYYRMLYNAAFFNMLPKGWVHKSKKHHDGEECFGGGWFIVMANLPTGQISNHYELKDWDLFQIPEKEVADKWDGHTPQEAADRLHKYLLEKQSKTSWKPSKEEMDVLYGLSYITNESDERKEEIIIQLYQDLKREFFNGASFENMFPTNTSAELEKQGKQKHNDKVEPKFKIKKGHWYVCIQSFVLNGTVVIKGQTYKSQEDNTVSGENARLFIDKHDGDASKYFKPWTIQDAKDGDVLEFEDHKRIVVGIVSFVNERTGKVDVSCLLEDNKFKIGNFYALDTIKPHPATKEQRDLLFTKMKEAGYEWDVKKKELKITDYSKHIKCAVSKDWLEKQGEQKEIDYDEELEKCKTNPLYFFDKYVKVKFKEQNPTDKVTTSNNKVTIREKNILK